MKKITTYFLIATLLPAMLNAQEDTTKKANSDTIKNTDTSKTADTGKDGTPAKLTSKVFWLETGTTMDFIDGPKLNNFTAGVFYHKLDNSWGYKKLKKGADTSGPNSFHVKHWSFFAGAYEAKIISEITNSQLSSEQYTSDKSFSPGKRDTIKTFFYAGKPKQTTTVRNWSFFASPALRLTNGSSNDSSFHLFLSAWVELRYQEVEIKTDNSGLLLIDSSLQSIKNINNFRQLNDTIQKTGIYSHYYGIGCPLYYEDKNIILFINPVIGFSNQPSLTSLSKIEDFSQGNPTWRPFYFVQFRLSDNVYGLTISGEIRGLIKKYSPPAYTIALTKKFNLDKLLKFN